MVLSTSVCPIKAEEGRKGAPGSGPSKLLRRWSFCFCTHPRMYVCLLYFSLPVPSGRFHFGFVLFFVFCGGVVVWFRLGFFPIYDNLWWAYYDQLHSCIIQKIKGVCKCKSKFFGKESSLPQFGTDPHLNWELQMWVSSDFRPRGHPAHHTNCPSGGI